MSAAGAPAAGHGPYETERDTIGAVQHILDSPPGTGAWPDGSLRLLEGACRAAGVKPGAYDTRILVWLAGFEPQTCAVIAGLIGRASETIPPAWAATVQDAFADAERYRLARLAEPCADCDKAKTDPERRELAFGLCERHLTDKEMFGLYRTVLGFLAPAVAP